MPWHKLRGTAWRAPAIASTRWKHGSRPPATAVRWPAVSLLLGDCRIDRRLPPRIRSPPAKTLSPRPHRANSQVVSSHHPAARDNRGRDARGTSFRTRLRAASCVSLQSLTGRHAICEPLRPLGEHKEAADSHKVGRAVAPRETSVPRILPETRRSISGVAASGPYPSGRPE